MSFEAAKPESTAEGLVRLGAAAIVVIFGLTLWNLYAQDTPSNWLSNIGVSIGDNSFRTLSLVSGLGLIIGVCLYLRKALWLIIAGGLVTIAFVGHGKGWYSLNNQTSKHVQMASVGGSSGKPVSNGTTTTVTFKGKQVVVRNTKVKMNKNHLAWCKEDDNGNDKKEPADSDGILNKDNSAVAMANCSTGYIHKR